MNKPEIRQALRQAHEQFINYLNGLSEAEFTFAADDKWTTGQQMEHIYLSLKPLRQIMMLPPFLLRWLWGKPNRPGRSYEALVARYQQKLSEGGRATGRFIPKLVPFTKREELAQTIRSEVEKIGYRLDHFSEQELNNLLLPHPLLGKLTLKEMMFFSIYHVGHHQKSIDSSRSKGKV
jgi:hypothetical protein